MELEIFNVEHGQCALLTCDNGERMLIDCGHNSTTGWTPGKHLQRLGVTTLDLLAVTNYDEDHVSGLVDLESRVKVSQFLRNKSVNSRTIRTLKSDTGIGTNMDRLADIISDLAVAAAPTATFPGLTSNVYYNDYPSFSDENNLSMVLVLKFSGTVFIFPGDMECAGWQQLLANSHGLQRDVAECHVLVASHHGRENGICPEMFTDYGCNPQVVVISDDEHKYDTQNTTSYYGSKCRGVSYRGRQRQVLTTRDDGNLRFVSQGTQTYLMP
jgi:beta-lactamase superfamily II metal-dependent hydrolase